MTFEFNTQIAATRVEDYRAGMVSVGFQQNLIARSMKCKPQSSILLVQQVITDSIILLSLRLMQNGSKVHLQ